MLILPVVWMLGVGMATYLFNFNARTRFLALFLVAFPPILGVTLALGPGGTGDAARDAVLVNWWLVIAASMIGLSMVLSTWEIARHRAEVRATAGLGPSA